METVEEEEEVVPLEETEWNELDISQLCRVCANPNEFLIPIFQGEGIEHDLKNKITEHLHLKIRENDQLPKNLCYQCASTLIAWHDLTVVCTEADEKLRAIVKDTDNEVFEEQEGSQDKTLSISQATSNKQAVKIDNQQVHVVQNNENLDLRNEMMAVDQDMSDDVNNADLSSRCDEMEEDSDNLNNGLGLTSDIEDEFLSDLESEEDDFEPLYSCNICNASGMVMNEFLKHARKHSAEERQQLLNKLATDKQLEEVTAKSTAASYGFIRQSYVISSANLYFCTICNQGNLLLRDLIEHNQLHPQSNEGHFCKLCQQRFEDNEKLADHLDKHLDNNDLFCQYCNKQFLVIEDLELHESLHFKSEYICVECCERFITKHSIMEHFRESHSTDTKCLICQAKFRSGVKRDKHLMIHAVIREVGRNFKTFPCVYCEKKYDNKVSLQRHVLFLHNDRMPYICHHCGYTTYHAEPLKSHVIQEHSSTYHCARCGITFGRKSDLDLHMIDHDDQNMAYLFCRLCGKMFRSEKNLKTHFYSHKGVNNEADDDFSSEKRDSSKDSPFVCGVCGLSFSVLETYNFHLEEHLYKVNCHLCEKRFENDDVLNVHLNKVHTSHFWKPDLQKGILPYQCEKCEASFRLEFDLEEHFKIHTALYQCHICFDEFGTDNELVNHIKNHKKEDRSGKMES